MLVLSRRENEQIVLPNLGVTIQVLGVKGKNVRIGVEAPRDVRVLRPEACDPAELEALAKRVEGRIDRHTLRNRLNVIQLGLHLFQKQNAAGQTSAAAATLERVLENMTALDRMVGEASGPVESVPTPLPSERPLQGRQGRVLVVEDDASEREMLADILRMHGFHVVSCGSGQEAVNVLSEAEPTDCVLLDLRMPGWDGDETLRRIRSNPRFSATRVIAVTGCDPEPVTPSGADRPQFDGWFPKPLDPDRLIDLVRDVTAAGGSSAA